MAAVTSVEHLRLALLHDVLDNEHVGVAVLVPTEDAEDFITVYANLAFQSLRPHVEMVGRRFTDAWSEAARFFIPPMRKVLQDGETWIAEDQAVEYEREPGRLQPAYFTFAVSRIDVDGGLGLVSEVQETTGQVEARHQALQELDTTRFLLETSRVLTERVQLQHVLARLAEVLLSSTSHTRSFVFLWDDKTRLLTRAASAGSEAFPNGQTFAFDDLSAVTKEVILKKRTAVVDFDALPEEQRGRALAAQRSHVLVVVPVVWQERLVGLIGVDDPGERREFMQREIEIVEGIAAQAATAIENARLFEERVETLHALEQKDREIRQAYSDVIDAVTGGRLILLGSDEIGELLRDTDGEEYKLSDPADLREARRRVRDAIGELPCLEDLTLAFSEGATNMLKHAGGGRYRACRTLQRVRIVLSDVGSGIDFRDLPKATLVSGYSTKQTLGFGFTVMMELTDRLLMSTDSGGTVLILERDLGQKEDGSLVCVVR